MELRGMNDRIKKLRKQSEETTTAHFYGTCHAHDGCLQEIRG